jgi:hypothetical protein
MNRHLVTPSTAPDGLSAAQRAFEIASILAAAIVRVHASGLVATGSQKTSVQLAILGDQRVHRPPTTRGKSL